MVAVQAEFQVVHSEYSNNRQSQSQSFVFLPRTEAQVVVHNIPVCKFEYRDNVAETADLTYLNRRLIRRHELSGQLLFVSITE